MKLKPLYPRKWRFFLPLWYHLPPTSPKPEICRSSQIIFLLPHQTLLFFCSRSILSPCACASIHDQTLSTCLLDFSNTLLRLPVPTPAPLPSSSHNNCWCNLPERKLHYVTPLEVLQWPHHIAHESGLDLNFQQSSLEQNASQETYSGSSKSVLLISSLLIISTG